MEHLRKKRSRIRFTKPFWAIITFILIFFIWIAINDPVEDQKESLERVENAAVKNNDVIAQTCLGIAYAFGEDVPENFNQSRKFLLNAAHQNNSAARYFLGILDIEGLGAYAPDPSKGWYNIEYAAEKEFVLALLKLAERELQEIQLFLNENENKNFKEETVLAIQQKANKLQAFLNRALVAKSHSALLHFDFSEDLKKSFPKTKIAFETDIEKFYEWVEIEVGIFYLTKNNPAQNPSKGLQILESYTNRSYEVLYYLGNLYEEGNFVNKNIDEAENYYLMGARNNDGCSYFLLGYLYLNHKNNFDKAHSYFKKAKENDFLAADFALGKMFFDRNEGVNDFQQAKEYFLKAAENNIAKASEYLKKIDTQLS